MCSYEPKSYKKYCKWLLVVVLGGPWDENVWDDLFWNMIRNYAFRQDWKHLSVWKYVSLYLHKSLLKHLFGQLDWVYNLKSVFPGEG